MTLTHRSRPLVFREGVLHETSSRTYTCAGDGRTEPWIDADGATHRERRRAPRCKRKIKGQPGYRFGAHLRRGRQRHCDACTAMFFVDAAKTWPVVRWERCGHCGKEYTLRREPKSTPVYNPRSDRFDVYYVGTCGCPGARAEREKMRRMNEEIHRRLAPYFERFMR